MKPRLRQQMREQLADLDPAYMQAASETITQRLLNLPALDQARHIALYISRPREPDTATLIQTLRQRSALLYLPRYQPGPSTYRLTLWPPGTDLVPGPYNILEPPPGPDTCPPDLDLLLVPALAFDRQGNRLGQGGGHYDRMLAAHPATRIGLCFAPFLLPRIPVEPHDLPMHLVITENEILHLPARSPS
ncbi:MAG TPA: 5-formyltetrahydrofolate cyclo-ligase [Kiritimatiellia bacterium]|nr:5-formyltetrahydrofolate cyclo-ligase [Kiritimatiellia bacterium]